MRTDIKVMEAMTKNPVVVKSNETVIACVKKMIDAEVGSLVVEEKGKLLGIFTEKDLMARVVAKELNLKKTLIKEVMSKRVLQIAPEADLYDAIYFMSREKVRRLPVTKNGKLMGLITYQDILKIQPDLYDIYIEKFRLKQWK